jgi:hypothetical protein
MAISFSRGIKMSQSDVVVRFPRVSRNASEVQAVVNALPAEQLMAAALGCINAARALERQPSSLSRRRRMEAIAGARRCLERLEVIG